MISLYNNIGGNVVSVIEVPRADTKKYGILDIGQDDGRVAEVRGLIEKPEPDKAPSTLSIVGRYILQPEIFELLAKVQKGSGGEIQLTDAMAGLIGKQPFHGYRFDGKRFDCGSQFGLVEAMLEYALTSESTALQARSFLKSKALALEGDRPDFSRQQRRAG
jgi:UTP--glucose-1-phosphate uridylyltransferase